MVKSRENASVMSRAILFAELALGLFVAFLLVRAVLGFVSPESLWGDAEEVVLPAAITAQQSGQTFSLNFDPFHRVASGLPVPENTGEDAPETTLNLTLTGLRAGPDGSAFLKTPDNKQAVYHIDDEIITGVTLQSVAPGYIVLSLNGRLERLTFERENKITLAAAPKNTSVSVSTLMSSVKIERVADGGATKGFRIKARGGAVNLADYGLQDGDVLVRIGGEDLTNGRPNIRRIITNGQKATRVSILRNGAPLTLTIGSQ